MDDRRSSWLAIGVWFAAVGPLVGGVALVAGVSLAEGGGGPPLFLVPALLGLTYAAGLIPAGVSGLICGGLSPRLPGTVAWLAAAAGVGAMVSAPIGAGIAAVGASDWRFTALAAALFGGAGAVAAFACAVLTQGHRPLAR